MGSVLILLLMGPLWLGSVKSRIFGFASLIDGYLLLLCRVSCIPLFREYALKFQILLWLSQLRTS